MSNRKWRDCEVLNYRDETLANVFIPLFSKLLDSYGLFYEQVDEWNLGTDPAAACFFFYFHGRIMVICTKRVFYGK